MSQSFTNPTLNVPLPLSNLNGGTGTSGTGMLDNNGNIIISYQGVASAVNHIDLQNAAASGTPVIGAVGNDSNISIGFQIKGLAAYQFFGTSSTPAQLNFYEDTDNGNNCISVAAPASISSNQTVTWKSASGGYPVLDTTDSDAWTDWSGTIGFTGFSANPTAVTAFYKKIGKICFIEVTMTNGTSNATSFTITGLPFTSATGRNQFSAFLPATNNGAFVSNADVIATTATTTLTLRLAGNGGGWTAASTKGANFQFYYETA